MDDVMWQLGWAGWCVVGAVAGLALGWERSALGDRFDLVARVPFGLKVVIAVMWAVSVALEVETLRGFLIVFLSSVGAYKVAAMIGEAAGFGWIRWRR